MLQTIPFIPLALSFLLPGRQADSQVQRSQNLQTIPFILSALSFKL
jgi:hypothetical protein